MSPGEQLTNLMSALHTLKNKVAMARIEAAVTSDLHERMAVAARVLDEVEEELTRLL